MIVLAVSRDTGGTNTILPVAKELNKDFDVKYIASGNAVEIMTASGESFETFDSAEEVLAKYPHIAALVTSMCYSGNGGIGRDLVPLLRGRSPIIAVQDLWGAQMVTVWENPAYRPDYLCVNDKLGIDIATRAWPDFDRSRIVPTGFPALDKYYRYNTDSISKEIRRLSGIRAGIPVVMFGGQGDGSGEALAEVVAVLNEINQMLYFIPRPHPNMKSGYPQEVDPWNEALNKFTGGLMISDLSDIQTSSILALSSVVISMYSTLLLEAAVLYKPNISVLYSNSLTRQQFEREAQGILDDPPAVTLGYTVKVTNRNALRGALKKALRNDLKLKSMALDGCNTFRTAKLVKNLIQKPR